MKVGITASVMLLPEGKKCESTAGTSPTVQRVLRKRDLCPAKGFRPGLQVCILPSMKTGTTQILN